MPIARRFCSKAATAALLSLALAGCTGGNLVESAAMEAPEARAKTHERVEKARALAPGSLYAARPGPEQTRTAGRATGTVLPLRTAPSALARRSARCRELEAIAGAQTTLLRSPTVSASARENGNLGATVAYDLVDLRRARLVEEEADALCRRALAAARVRGFVSSALEATSYEGYRARSMALRAQRPEIAAVRASVSERLRTGHLTMPQASQLRQYVARIEASEAKASADARQRETLGGDRIALLGRAVSELVAAEHDLAEIARRRRTADAVSLSVSGGYSDVANADATSRQKAGETYARVKMSLRTGALLPGRSNHEDVATAARLAGLDDEGTGALWKLDELRAASRRGVADLQGQIGRLRRGIREAGRILAEPPSPLDDGLDNIKLRARLDVVSLRADLAAAEATLRDVRRTAARLDAR